MPGGELKSLSPGKTLLIGSMLFGLFFGAGNLIFPVEMGRAAGSATGWATIGFLITAVGLPLAGVVASAISGSRSMMEMTSTVSRWYAVAFTTALYLTIGPLFAIPRTATVSYEVGFAGFVPQGSEHLMLALFSIVFFGLVLIAALRPSRLMDIVGRYLTPIFLVLLAGVLIAAFVKPMSSGPLPAPTETYTSPVTQGFLDGYNTMDALASLAFAIVVIEAINRLGVTNRSAVATSTLKSGLVMVLAMSAIYASLAYVGATSAGVTGDADNGGTMLARISEHYYGAFGLVLIAAIVFVACLKTAIGLVTACAEMFNTMFPNVMSAKAWTVSFTVLSAIIANFGLKTIIAWSIPVLMFLYPLAIIAIILGLLTPLIRGKKLIYQLTTGLVAVAAVFDLIKALPVQNAATEAVVAAGTRVLPGFPLGFGWALPALLGLCLGWVLSLPKPKKA